MRVSVSRLFSSASAACG
ncbi:hypothetical protein ECEC4448_0257, partial [Escherichia coli EC4448]